MKWIAALPLCLIALAVPARADDAKDVRATVEGSVNSVLAVLKDKKVQGEERKTKVMAVMDSNFDLSMMGKLTLGKTHWGEFSEDERKDFAELFVRTIKDTYYDKIELFSDETVDYGTPAPAEKGKYQMLTSVVSKGSRYKIQYKLFKKEGAWKVYDAEIEGISLVKTYGQQYDQFLAKGTPKELLAKLKEKSLSTPADLEKATKKQEDAKKEKKS